MSDNIFAKGRKLSFMLNCPGKWKLDNIKVSFLGKEILQTLLLVGKKLLTCRDSVLFILCFINILKKHGIISAFLKISRWSTEAELKTDLKPEFQAAPDGSTKQSLLQAADLEDICQFSLVQPAALGSIKILSTKSIELHWLERKNIAYLKMAKYQTNKESLRDWKNPLSPQILIFFPTNSEQEHLFPVPPG